MTDYRDPSRREHFVYRAFDSSGTLLYVGCTMNLAKRQSEHRTSSEWYGRAHSFHLHGPYTYDKGRAIEREAIHTESPLFNCDEPRRARVRVLHTRITNRWFRLFLRRGLSVTDAHSRSWERAEWCIPNGSAKTGVHVTTQDLAAAARAEQADLAAFHATEEAVSA